jgi:3-dehydroquinate synthase class II
LIFRTLAGPVFKYVITPQAENAYFSDLRMADLTMHEAGTTDE